MTPHPAWKWQKKIGGKIHYFGRWMRIRNGKVERIEGDGWREALELYKAQAEDRHVSRPPRFHAVGEGLTLKELCNRFLTAKQRKRERGGIAALTFEGYPRVTNLLIEQFGKLRRVALQGPWRPANSDGAVFDPYDPQVDASTMARGG